MNGKEIVKKYPKVTQELISWFKNAQKTGNKDFDSALGTITEGTVAFLLSAGNPRFLYEFLDERELFITIGITNISLFEGEEPEPPFLYRALLVGSKKIFEYREHRHQAEEDGFLEAFETLESRL